MVGWFGAGLRGLVAHAQEALSLRRHLLRLPSPWAALVVVWACASLALWVGQFTLLQVGGVQTPMLFSFDWQPDLWCTQPWRLWTAAWVHWSGLHLLFNLLGCAVLVAWGHAADLKLRHTLAWCLAWPLVQMLLYFSPALPHYGGLSGVLHAGVAIGCWALVRQTDTPRRWVGAWVLLGLCLKVAQEQPALRYGLGGGDALSPLIGASGWSVASSAHRAGVVVGLACAALVDAIAYLRGRFSPAAPDGTVASR